MRRSKYVLFLILLAALVTATWFALRPSSPALKPEPIEAKVAASAAKPAALVKAPEQPALPPPPPVNKVEAAATARMVEAHSPLRAPEIANPDSDSNRQILQNMVFKALQRTAAVENRVTTAP